MNQSENWSSDSQAHTRICILESQVEVKDNKIARLHAKNLQLQLEVERLQQLVAVLNSQDNNINNNDATERFK